MPFSSNGTAVLNSWEQHKQRFAKKRRGTRNRDKAEKQQVRTSGCSEWKVCLILSPSSHGLPERWRVLHSGMLAEWLLGYTGCASSLCMEEHKCRCWRIRCHAVKRPAFKCAVITEAVLYPILECVLSVSLFCICLSVHYIVPFFVLFYFVFRKSAETQHMEQRFDWHPDIERF